MENPDKAPELEDIPAFLRRNPDGSIPDIKPDITPAAARKTTKRPESVLADHRSPLEQAERRAAIDAQKKQKAYGRIEKLKAVKADREAVAAGKTWDPNKAKWV